MAANVHITMTADEAKAWSAIQKVSGAFTQMGGQAGKAARTAKKGFSEGIRDAGKFALQIAGVGSAFAVVIKAVAQLSKEYENLKRRQSEAADAQITTQQARSRAIANAQDKFSTSELDDMVKRLSARRRVPVAQIWQGLRSPLSAMGPLSKGQFVDAMDQALRVTKLTGEEPDELAGGILDIQKLSGGTGRQSAGFLNLFGRAARITDLDAQVSSAAKVTSAAKAFGATLEESAEMAAFLSGMSSDITGKQSTTSGIKFMEAAATAEMIPERVSGGFGQAPSVKFRRLTGRNFTERLVELQEWYASADAELRKEFASKVPGRAASKGGLLQLIQRTPEAMAAMGSVRSQIPSPTSDAAAAAWERVLGRMGSGGKAAIVDLDQDIKTLATNIKEANTRAVSGRARTGLDEILGAVPGLTDMAKQFATARFELRSGFGDDPVAARRVLTEVLQETSDRFGFNFPRIRSSPRASVSGGSTRETFVDADADGFTVANPNYNPAAYRELQTFIENQNIILREMAAARSADGSAATPVKIVGDSRPTIPAADAQTEGAP